MLIRLIITVLFSVVIAWFHPLAAQETNEPYCLPDTRFAPDGLILKMADRYFRVRSNWSDSESGRQHILQINPAQVEGLENNYAASNLRLDDRFPILRRIAGVLRYNISSGTRTFGEATYQAYESVIHGPNGFPGGASYLYDPGLSDEGNNFPVHYVTCAGEG